MFAILKEVTGYKYDIKDTNYYLYTILVKKKKKKKESISGLQ